MNLNQIDGHSIYNLFISGANNLIYSEHILNSINVFPVADGDTGTNLALTMKSIVANAIKDTNVHKALSSISNIAIFNAYGNSGLIFAQYFHGFAMETHEKDTLTISEFADIANKASMYAYEAVADPKDGTILSVMKDWAFDLQSNLNNSNLEKSFERSVNRASLLVEQTTTKLKVLKDHNVVDAGAKGFLIFLEGILDFIKLGKLKVFSTERTLELDSHTNIQIDTEITTNRYCSQFYIHSKKAPSLLKVQLKSLGDSLIVTGSKNLLHIHIHTDFPEKVMSYLLQEDTILSQKIEDMKIMNLILHKRKHSIGLITDSIADLPQSFIDNEQITVIPMNLICDSIVFQDKLTMTHELFYEKMKHCNQYPTSTQPTSIVIEKTCSLLLKYFDSLIGIFVSKQMSGTFENAQRVAKTFLASGQKISVIDSKLNSSAEGLLVMEAATLINNGLFHEEIVEQLKKRRAAIQIYVAVNDLSNMINGGRISKTKGFILDKIHLKPVISIDEVGKGIVYKKTFSQRSANKKIFDKIKWDIKERGILTYAIVYSDTNELFKKFCEDLVKITGMQPSFIEHISPVVALNAGLGAYAVSYIKKGDE